MNSPNIALIINSDWDETQALRADPHLPLSINKLGMEHAVEILSTNSVMGAKKAIKKFEPNQIRVLWIRTHGDNKGLWFNNNPNTKLTHRHTQDILDIFANTHPDCVVFLGSCCEDGENKLAKKINALTGRTVFAAEKSPFLVDRCYLIRNENNNQFEMHNFNNESIDVIVKYEKSKKTSFANQSSKIKDQVEAQGYTTSINYYENLPLARLKLMHEQAPSDATLYSLAGHLLKKVEKTNPDKLTQELLEEAVSTALQAGHTGYYESMRLIASYSYLFEDYELNHHLDSYDALIVKIQKSRNELGEDVQSFVDEATQISGNLLFLRAKNHQVLGRLFDSLKDYKASLKRGNKDAMNEMLEQGKKLFTAGDLPQARLWLLSAQTPGHPEAESLLKQANRT